MRQLLHSNPRAEVADRLASRLKSQWREGERADVAAVLREHPELTQHRSVVLDLAYDEYRQRLDRGEAVDADAFSRRFPSWQKSLYLFILARGLLDQDAEASEPHEPARWPQIGDEFLGFCLLDELGRGAFARVFLASEPSLGNRLVALKLALQGAAEAEMLGRLRHPNIVPVYSVREDPQTCLTAVCMPYLGRTTLCDVLDRAFATPAPPRDAGVVLEAIRDLHDPAELSEATWEGVLRNGSYLDGVLHLVTQLVDGLAYAHARGICHGDLKPSNVLISTDGRPLLLDFNLSHDRGAMVTRFGGTIPYMAPEQLRIVASETIEGPPNADPRSDLFSCGVIAYELLSGSLPFGPIRWSGSLDETAENLLEHEAEGPRPLREQNAKVDERLAKTIERCLAFDPDDRPPSAAALAAELRRQLHPVARAKRWARRHRTPVAAVIVTLLLAAVALAAWLALRPPYYARQLHMGLQCLERGEYDPAIEHLSQVIQARPDCSEALMARGRAYQLLGDPRTASLDFQAVLERERSPAAAAAMGYCLGNLKHVREAAAFSEIALRTGHDSAALLNNLGHACLQLGRYEDAEKYLQQACERAPEMQAPHHGLAVLYLNQAIGGKPVPAAAYGHALKAIEVGPPCAELYHLAAALCMAVARQAPDAIDQALGFLEKAKALGLDVKTLGANPLFEPLQNQERFQRLVASPSDTKPVPPTLLVDPL